MNNFGKLKSNLLKKITTAYSQGNKKEVKSLFKQISENTDFKDVYLFYENFEKKYIANDEISIAYIAESEKMLREKLSNISILCENLNKKCSDIQSEENPVYEMLDKLSEPTTLHNVEERLQAKVGLIKHLTTPKTEELQETKSFSENEPLLMTLLATEFNAKFDEVMSESEKEKFNEIVNMTPSELQENFTNAVSVITASIDTILLESEGVNSEFSDKLNLVKTEINDREFEVNRVNYLKLQTLQNDLK